MAEFPLKFYVSRTNTAAARCEGRARVAAEGLNREGTPIRFLRSIVVPEGETCFYLYEAASVEAVRELAGRAALPVDRIAEAVATPRGDGR